MSEGWEAVVLAGWRRGRDLAAVGPGPVEGHLAHARALAAAIPHGARRGLDLGSGAGIPGLALAGIRAEMAWVLLDASRRRTRLVAEVIAAAGWSGRVEAVHERAEVAGRDPAWRQQFDVVTARSFGRPAVTAECAAPFVRPGGVVLVADPPTDEPGRWPPASLTPLGLVPGPAGPTPQSRCWSRSAASRAGSPANPASPLVVRCGEHVSRGTSPGRPGRCST